MVIKTKCEQMIFLSCGRSIFSSFLRLVSSFELGRQFLASFALTYRVRHGHWFLLTWVGSFVFGGSYNSNFNFGKHKIYLLGRICFYPNNCPHHYNNEINLVVYWIVSNQTPPPSLSLSCSFCHSVSFPPFTCKLNWAWLYFFSYFFSNNFSCWVSLRGFIHSYKNKKVAEIDLFLLLQMIFFCVGWFVFLSFLCLPVVSFFILSLQLFWKRENLGIKQKAFFFSWICYVVVQVCHSKLMRKTDTKKRHFSQKQKLGNYCSGWCCNVFVAFFFISLVTPLRHALCQCFRLMMCKWPLRPNMRHLTHQVGSGKMILNEYRET